LLVALNYECWDGGNKETSLGQKSVLKGEELETTREYGTYEDEDALGAGRHSSIEGCGWYSSLPCNEKTAHGGSYSPCTCFLACVLSQVPDHLI
jgi:hypothetical protein